MTSGPYARIRAIRAIVRWELRELRRHRRRSLLVLLLVAIPVAAVVAGTSLVRVTTPTDEELRSGSVGSAALRVERPFAYEERARLLDLLPAHAKVQTLKRGTERVGVSGRQLRAESIVIGPLPASPGAPGADDPLGLARGMFLLQQGRVPRNAGEVALSPVLLEGLGRAPGQAVTLEYGARREIVGVVVDADALDAPLVVRQAAAVEHDGSGYLLVGLDEGAEQVAAELRDAGYVVRERGEITGEGSDLAWGLFVLGSIGFLEGGLVVAATFLVGLRRRQYEIGLLGSTGATGRAIAASLLVATGALAAVGAIVGAALGSVGAALCYPFLDGWNRRVNGPFEIAWDTLLAAMVSGVLVAVVATALPSWAAGRMPIRQALGGRRPVKTRSVGWLGLGLAMIATGLALVLFAPRDPAIAGALAAIVGSVLGVLGFGVSSPFVLGLLGRSAGRLPLRWRLAVRDAGRFRARNGPVVTAILAGMSMSVTVAVLLASLEAAIDALPSAYRTDQLIVAGPDAEGVASRLATDLQGIALSPLEAVYVYGEPVRVRNEDEPLDRGARQWIAAGDPALLAALGAEDGLEALEAGRLLHLRAPGGGVLERLGVKPEARGAGVELSTWRDGGALTPLPVTVVTLDQNTMSPAYVLHRSKIEQLGWQAGPPIDRSLTPWLVRFDDGVTPAVLAQAREVAAGAVGVTIDAQLLRQRPTRSFYHVVQWLCIATGLVIVMVATALSAAESVADARVLHSLGATPSLLRGHPAAQAGYLAFLGCLLAIPAGLIPAIVLFEAANLPLDLVVPWVDLGIALLALPLLAYGVTWIASRPDDRRQFRWPERVAGVLVAATLATGNAMSAATPSEIRWEPFVGEAFDGSPLPGELGRLVVPRKHAEPDGATMELAFVRYRTSHPRPGPPVIYLAGGPGGSGVEHAGKMATHPQMRFLEHADFIGLDQRGTGRSTPSLVTPPELQIELPLDRAVSRSEMVSALQTAARKTVAYWRARGIDASAYNSRESADDIDQLRRALGLEQIVTYGASYGSHLGLAHLRRYPETVARSLLTKVEGPDHTWKLPRTVQAHLAAVHERCRNDARIAPQIPDLLQLVQDLLALLAEQPAAATAPDETKVVVGAYDLQSYLANALSTSTSRAELPGRLLEFARDDFSRLAETALDNRRIRIELMPWATDCASGATPARLAEIRKQSRDGRMLLGDAILAPFFPETCATCPGCDLGDEFRSPPIVDVPVLFVSGTLDVRTPPENVDEIAPGFSHHAHVRVTNAGHEARELMSPEYRALFQAFLRGDPVKDTAITLPPVLLALEDADRTRPAGH